jgi:peptidoglycan-associated lipoprotein
MTLVVMLAGCATAAPPAASVDLTGPWSGVWEGYGILSIKRHDVATAKFTQIGDRGVGRLWLEGVLASESVPESLRMAGLAGVPVRFEVSGNHVVLRHELDESLLQADFIVTGDRMVGHLRDTELPARIVLERVPAQAAAAPAPAPAPVAAAAAPAPAPPPPVVAPAPPPAPVAVRPPAPQEFTPTDALKPVYFDFDRSDIRPSEATVLEGNARWLQTNREVLLIIEGHCDERGTNEYNLALGERRARSARDYLVSHGVAANRITTVSYGEERPVCREKNEGCWRQNRRGAFVVKPK